MKPPEFGVRLSTNRAYDWRLWGGLTVLTQRRQFLANQVPEFFGDGRVKKRWADLSAIALRLEVCRRLTGADLRELLAPSHRAALKPGKGPPGGGKS